MMLAKTNSI